MDENMADTNGELARHYLDAAHAQLGERVTNLGRRQTDLENEMRSGFKQIETSFSNFSNETRQSIAGISSSIAERSRPQWQALGVALTFAALLGGLAYLPIREATSDLKGAVKELASMVVTQREFAQQTARSAEDRMRTEQAIIDMRANLVPRLELQRVWESYDQRLTDHQRQIDEAKSTLGNTYSLRDYIQRLTDRVDTLESRVIRPSAQP